MTITTTHDRPLAPVLFAAAVTVVGIGAAVATFAATGGNPSVDPGLTRPALWPPDAVFWMVWLIIYPASGIAAWHVWRQRHTSDVRGALTAFVLLNVGAALFLPVSALVGGMPAVLTLMDTNGLVSVCAVAWLFSRYSRTAAWWMAPYLLWMPLTTVLKAWLWAIN